MVAQIVGIALALWIHHTGLLLMSLGRMRMAMVSKLLVGVFGTFEVHAVVLRTCGAKGSKKNDTRAQTKQKISEE